MWQKCPICNGTGTTYYPVSNNTSTVCTTCNGQKIISELTGRPPVVSSGDFRDDDNMETQR